MAAIAAILDKIRRPFCIGFFSSMVQIHPMSFKWIGASVLLLLNGNQIQDGCHIGKVKTQIFNNVLLLHGPNPPYEFKIDWYKCSPLIERKPNARWLPWTCFIMWACEPTYWYSLGFRYRQGTHALRSIIVNYSSERRWGLPAPQGAWASRYDKRQLWVWEYSTICRSNGVRTTAWSDLTPS